MYIKDSEGEKLAAVPYFVHEEEMWRQERIIKRLIVAIITETIVFMIYGRRKNDI